MGGDAQTSQTTQTQTQVPGFLNPFINQGVGTAQGAVGRLEDTLGGATGADLIAGFDPLQQQAQQQLVDIAGGAGGFLPTAQQGLLDTAQGDFLFGGSGFDAAVNASLNLAQPRIASAFNMAGGSGDPLAGVALQQVASDAFARQFGQERTNQLGALRDLPGIAQIGPGILEGVGAARQGLEQQRINAPISAEQTLLQAALSGVPVENLLGTTKTFEETLEADETLGSIGGLLTGGSALLSALGLGGQTGNALSGLLGGGGLGGTLNSLASAGLGALSLPAGLFPGLAAGSGEALTVAELLALEQSSPGLLGTPITSGGFGEGALVGDLGTGGSGLASGLTGTLGGPAGLPLAGSAALAAGVPLAANSLLAAGVPAAGSSLLAAGVPAAGSATLAAGIPAAGNALLAAGAPATAIPGVGIPGITGVLGPGALNAPIAGGIGDVAAAAAASQGAAPAAGIGLGTAAAVAAPFAVVGGLIANAYLSQRENTPSSSAAGNLFNAAKALGGFDLATSIQDAQPISGGENLDEPVNFSAHEDAFARWFDQRGADGQAALARYNDLQQSAGMSPQEAILRVAQDFGLFEETFAHRSVTEDLDGGDTDTT